MNERRRKMNAESDSNCYDSDTISKVSCLELIPFLSKEDLINYLKFVFYCTLLAVPLYAITMSVLKHDWLMVVIDALIVPIGFVHGILLLTGLVN